MFKNYNYRDIKKKKINIFIYNDVCKVTLTEIKLFNNDIYIT